VLPSPWQASHRYRDGVGQNDAKPGASSAPGSYGHPSGAGDRGEL
jgi:hypothetical protein